MEMPRKYFARVLLARALIMASKFGGELGR